MLVVSVKTSFFHLNLLELSSNPFRSHHPSSHAHLGTLLMQHEETRENQRMGCLQNSFVGEVATWPAIPVPQVHERIAWNCLQYYI